MIISNTMEFTGRQITALICSDKVNNTNKYYFCFLDRVKGKFVVTFKYGRRGKDPIVKKQEYDRYSDACKAYNKKVSAKSKEYTEVLFEDVMDNTDEFIDVKEYDINNI